MVLEIVEKDIIRGIHVDPRRTPGGLQFNCDLLMRILYTMWNNGCVQNNFTNMIHVYETYPRLTFFGPKWNRSNFINKWNNMDTENVERPHSRSDQVDPLWN